MKRLLAAVALTLATAAAHAQFWDGNELYARMNASDPGDRRSALGYLAGASDAMDTVHFCLPPNVRLNQIHDVVMILLRDSASTRHQYSADAFIRVALRAAWPCAGSR